MRRSTFNSYLSFLFLLGIQILVLSLVGCSSVSVPTIDPKAGQAELSNEAIRNLIQTPPKPQQRLVAENSPFPDQALAMLKTGEKSVYGVIVTPGLETAYRAYLAGEGDLALSALAADEKTAEESGTVWQLSFFKAQVLLMMGKAAEAELELERTSRLETAFIGHNLNSTALRAEVRTWMEDYDGALRDLAMVIQAIGTWELPISYLSFPTNRDQLFILTTAKLRAYTVLTAIHIFREDYQAAYEWGKETERLFNNAHFVINHPLYGAGDSTHADSYYGRALNLTFLASATLAVHQDLAEAESIFKVADAFYDFLGYSAGKVTTAALKARIYNRLGMHDLCYQAGQSAMKLAIENNFPDYVWRIGILTGKTLLAKGREAEAEQSFRQAQASVDLISGGLAADRAKIRFGVGKEDITYHLAQLDIQKRAWQTLFLDLETGRARAFTDLLRDRPVIQNRHTDLMKEISALEQMIRNQRLKNMAPGNREHEDLIAETQLIKQRDMLIQTLKKKDPDLAKLITVSVSSLADVQSGLADGEMLAYFIPGKSDDKVRFLKITNVSVELEELLISVSELEKQIDDFSYAFFDPEDLEKRGIILKTRAIKDEEPVTPEYAVSTLKKSLRIQSWGVQKNLYIIPTGILYFMPWAVLDSSFPISTLPTGDWLNMKSGPRALHRKIAIVGDPEFGGLLPQLAGAREEANQIGKLYGIKPLLGKNATEESVRQQVGDGVRILHFATHGIYDTVRPLESALFLTRNGNAAPLTAKNLYENPIPAELVILSACETGLGKTVAGDDLLGLTRSFYLGGTRSILSSLWEIEDEGTKEFMLKFHQNAANGNYGKAWLQARDYVKSLGFPASVYGAFILGGQL